MSEEGIATKQIAQEGNLIVSDRHVCVLQIYAVTRLYQPVWSQYGGHRYSVEFKEKTERGGGSQVATLTV